VRKVPHWCGDEVFLVDPAQVAEGFSEGQGVGVSVSKPCGGHAPRLMLVWRLLLATERTTLQRRVPSCSNSLL
jgi:hypothetical protein